SKPVVQKLASALSTQLGHPVQLALQSTSRPVQTPAVASDQASRQQLSEAEVA
ncbi:MAG: hypothetical protein GTN56_06690, partial [Xanthomonadales bacterium]|nr:hypothetical protein [Xanthomonadales bacterium]NIP11881.1 hypothetical protein [Xanthomonadales bacterium]NIT07142.1 hypothetical protein [Xanthomonadales bacterium]